MTPTPPAFEKNLGMSCYLTTTDGIKGRLKNTPQDFIVQEVYKHPPQHPEGTYTIAELSSINWETHTLQKELSKRLGISRKRIHFAGTKDKRAHTSQLISIANITPNQLEQIKIKDVEFHNLYTSKHELNIGDLKGNRFTITISGISKDIIDSELKKTTEQLNAHQGFANYFGIQRFGSTRPITHLVGKALVQEDFQKAAMIYIASPQPDEDPHTQQLRQNLQDTLDYKNALESYPKHLNFERSIISHLHSNPDDYIGAIKTLPFNLQTLFINAYQSYLFNKMISLRLKAGLMLNQAIEGDIILAKRNHSYQKNDYIGVTSRNIDKVNTALHKGLAAITTLLVGNTAPLASGEMGEIESSVIEEEKLNPKDFTIPKIPRISSHGTRRSIHCSPTDLHIDPLQQDTTDNKFQQLSVHFTLPKGTYATTLLREYMKATHPTDYS